METLVDLSGVKALEPSISERALSMNHQLSIKEHFPNSGW